MIRALAFAKIGLNYGARQVPFLGGMPIEQIESQDRRISVLGENRSTTVAADLNLFVLSVERESFLVGAEQRQNVVEPENTPYNVPKGNGIFII